MTLKRFLMIFLSLSILLINMRSFSFNFYKFEDKTKNFISCDMNTAIIGVLTDRSIILIYLLSKYRNIREPMFMDEIDFQGGTEISVIEYNIFVFTKDNINVFKCENGKIEFLKKIEEKNVIKIEKSFLNSNRAIYCFYKKNSISIYNDFFYKIKEEILDKNMQFITSNQEESIYKDKKGEYYLIKFDGRNNFIKNKKELKGEILYYESSGMYLLKDKNDTISIYYDSEIVKKINPYKDLKRMPKYKNILSFNINKVLFLQDNLGIIGEAIFKDNSSKCSLIYDNNYTFCKIETPTIAEIFAICIKNNQFGDIIFLTKNLFYYFYHGLYYSCNNL